MHPESARYPSVVVVSTRGRSITTVGIVVSTSVVVSRTTGGMVVDVKTFLPSVTSRFLLEEDCLDRSMLVESWMLSKDISRSNAVPSLIVGECLFCCVLTPFGSELLCIKSRSINLMRERERE